MPSELEEQLDELLRSAGFPPFEREYRFHPLRRWRFDFAFVGHQVAVEVEGATWSNGRHNRGAGFLEDSVKYDAAAGLGWRLVRVNKNLLNDGRAIELIRRALDWETTTLDRAVAEIVAGPWPGIDTAFPKKKAA